MLKKTYNANEMNINIELINEIKKKYVAGFTINTIAEMYNVTYYRVRQILLDNDIPLRTKGNRISK